jgi:hypothetical protein
MNDEAKAEAGRLQQICIEEMAANEPSYLKGVYYSMDYAIVYPLANILSLYKSSCNGCTWAVIVQITT